MVYIEKIELKGFKSFGNEKVSIELSPKFSAIVGPNGSGKSNVIDALCFALGQLSTKTMRISSFSDLLFKPTKKKGQTGAKSGYVELHINNKDRKMAYDADKVIIRREISLDGGTAYKVNGKSTTRTDVLDMLSTIGVDPNGYNIVLQGEIAHVVQVSPIERRKLIERISGIAAFDVQKEKALKKLDEATKKLSQVDTQLSERRRMLERLERDRQEAIRYKELSWKRIVVRKKISEQRKNYLIERIKKLENMIEAKKQEIEDITQQIKNIESEIAKAEQEREEIAQKINEIAGKEASQISIEWANLRNKIEQLQIKLETLQDTITQKENEREKYQQRLKSINEEIEQLSEERYRIKISLEEINQEINEKNKELEELNERLESEGEAYFSASAKINELSKIISKLEEERSNINSKHTSNEREIKILNEDIESFEKQISEFYNEKDKIQEKIKQREEEIFDNKIKLDEITEDIDREKSKFRDISKESIETRKIYNKTREELIKIEARNNALKEAQEKFFSKQGAISAILKLRDTEEIEGIYGTVAELGTINPQYSTALEIAGGGRLSYIVVKNEEVAAKCIRYLKQKRLGRVSFIPLDKIRARVATKEINDLGVIGYAIELVDFDEDVRKAFEYVFGDTLVVETYDDARRIGFKGQRIVTLDGDLIEASGLVTGGHYTPRKHGLTLKQEDNREELEEKLRGLERILSDIEERKKNISQHLQELENEKRRLEIEINNSQKEIQQLKERKNDIDYRITSLKERLEQTKEKIIGLNNEQDELESQLQEIENKIKQRKSEIEEFQTLIETSSAKTLNKEISEKRKKLDELTARKTEILQKYNQIDFKINSSLLPSIEEINGYIEQLNNEIPELYNQIDRIKVDIETLNIQFKEIDEKKDVIEQKVGKYTDEQSRINQHIKELRGKLDALNTTIQNKTRNLYRQENEKEKTQDELNLIEIEIKELNAQKLEAPEEVIQDFIKSLKNDYNELKERLGEIEGELNELKSINMKALEEYDNEKKLYDELAERRAKLEEDYQEILRFIDELETEKTKKFMATFNSIADNFTKVFARLSPGGSAQLILDDPEHPLMGGITVRAKPRGKDVASLTAMSGGEKTITGLALIFAIQRYSPSAFYILDEIDAALDNANAGLVAKLIKEFSETSQFIIISLRDPTIRLADRLIGVTNQDGISKIVSVELEEVLSNE